MIERRQFIRGALSLLAAPAIVRVSSIMPVKPDNLVMLDFCDIDDFCERILQEPWRLGVRTIVVSPGVHDVVKFEGAGYAVMGW